MSLALRIACALGLACASLWAAPSDPEPASRRDPLFERVFAVGASASSGFLLEADVGARASLTDLLEAMIVGDHEPVERSSSITFFLAPLSRGGKQLDLALEHRPTLLVALDFLFWFGYGNTVTEEERLERLEQGLWLLDRFEGPVLVCDFPDMSPALRGRGPLGGPMIHAGQVPRPETLKRLNARLSEWARERGDVVIVPLSSFLERLRSGEAIELRDNRWESAESLFRSDLLHPNLDGSAALLVLAFDALAGRRDDLPDEALRWDARAVARRVYDAKEPSRKQAEERKRVRDEARAAREKR